MKTWREQLECGEAERATPVDRYREINPDRYPQPPAKKKADPFVLRLSNTLKRKRIEKKLHKWGIFRESLGVESPLRKIADLEGDTPIMADGWDRGLSDHDAEMIQIGYAVERLNHADYKLIIYEFRRHYSNPKQAWCNKFGMKPDTYRKHRAAALLLVYDWMYQ